MEVKESILLFSVVPNSCNLELAIPVGGGRLSNVLDISMVTVLMKYNTYGMYTACQALY